MNSGIFREYDIRGVADRDLNSKTIERVSRALGTFFVKQGVTEVAIGRDCRMSSPRIAGELVAGLRSTGLHTVDVGLVPTPLLYFAVPHLKLGAGIMVTGSHNPPDHNGLKICLGTLTIYGDQIQEVRTIAESQKFDRGQGRAWSTDIGEEYLSYVANGFRKPIELSVAVDSGNGMAGPVAPELYRRLGCQVTELFSIPDGTFPNHHPDPTVVENLEDVSRTVRENKLHLGIGFDGDADRIGAVDADGKMIFGDELLALYAAQVLRQNPGAVVISDVKASHRLFSEVARLGGRPLLWKTGHSLIKAKMRETGSLLAGEMSGHVFFKDRYYGFDDAIYAGARLLEIVHAAGQPLRSLLAHLPPSVATAEIRVDCPDEIKFGVVSRSRTRLEKAGLKVNAIDGARVEFEDGWGLVRASNTQPVLVFRFEANAADRLAEIRKTVETVVFEEMNR